MKIAMLVAAAALAGVVFAPIAQAQASCEDIANILAAAESDFEDVLGDEIDDELFESTLVLAGARECTVAYDWDSAYLCVWQTPDEASAKRMVDTQLATLRACLTGDWREEALPESSDKWRLIAGSNFKLSIGDEELVFVARADATREEDPTIYEVELSLTYIWF